VVMTRWQAVSMTVQALPGLAWNASAPTARQEEAAMFEGKPIMTG
jgi:hypothetical protein